MRASEIIVKAIIVLLTMVIIIGCFALILQACKRSTRDDTVKRAATLLKVDPKQVSCIWIDDAYVYLCQSVDRSMATCDTSESCILGSHIYMKVEK